MQAGEWNLAKIAQDVARLKREFGSFQESLAKLQKVVDGNNKSLQNQAKAVNVTKQQLENDAEQDYSILSTLQNLEETITKNTKKLHDVLMYLS